MYDYVKMFETSLRRFFFVVLIFLGDLKFFPVSLLKPKKKNRVLTIITRFVVVVLRLVVVVVGVGG